jgi:hypothetical protein
VTLRARWVTLRASLGGAESSLGGAESSLGGAESSLDGAESSLGGAESSLGGAESSLGDAERSLGDAESSLGDAKSSLSDAKSSLGDAKSSLDDAKSSLGDANSRHTAVQKLRIGRGDRKWTTPRLSRRTCSPRYGLQSWRGKSAGVAKRPLLSHTNSPIRNFCIAVLRVSGGSTHLDGARALHHVHGRVGDGPRDQVLQQVACLDHPEIRVRVLVVPHQARLARLHEAARRALAEVVEHQLRRRSIRMEQSVRPTAGEMPP